MTSCAINIALATSLTFLIYRGHGRIALFGLDGAVLGLLPATLIFTLTFSIAMTLIVRKRLAKGVLRRLEDNEGPQWSAWLPKSLLLRAPLLTVVVCAAFLGSVSAVLYYAASTHWSLGAVIALNVAFFLIVSWVVTALTVWRAMHD